MIGESGLGADPTGIVGYCYYEKQKGKKIDYDKLSRADVRGEVIYVQNLALSQLADGRYDVKDIGKQISDNARLNTGLKKFVWHQMFSFPVNENPTNEQLQEIIEAFSKDFGFEENQLLAFKHTDTDHVHIHIVGNRINLGGRTTAKDSNNFYRNGIFCRKMELKLGLTIIENMNALKTNKEKNVGSKSDLARQFREKIDKNIGHCKTLDELKTVLKRQEGLKMYVGRGVSFTDMKTGTSFKGSDLGRAYSLKYLIERLGVETEQRPSLVVTSKLSQSIVVETKEKDSLVKQEASSKNIEPNIHLEQSGGAANRKFPEDEEEEERKKRLALEKQRIRGFRRR